MKTTVKRKSFFTLLELLIALSLTLALLSTLLFFYRIITLSNSSWEKKENEQQLLRYVEARLIYCLSRASVDKNKNEIAIDFHTVESTSPWGQSSLPALLFCFDNGIKRDKKLSNDTLGLLFVDKHGNLTLSFWPAPIQWENEPAPPMRQSELLLTGVKELRFRFFSAINKEEKTSQADQQQKDIPSHTSQWLKEWKKLPHIVYVDITAGEETMTFAIPIAKAQPFITYKE